MFDRHIIEIYIAHAGITVQAGIVVRDGHCFRFFAVTDAFNGLEDRLFQSPKAAERAALRQVMHKASAIRRSEGRWMQMPPFPSK